VLALPTLSWHWLNSTGAYAGHALLEHVLAKNLLPSAVLGFFPNIHWCCEIYWAVMCVLLKLYDLTVKQDHACVANTVSFSYSFS
jgi:hypothetical protein